MPRTSRQIARHFIAPKYLGAAACRRPDEPAGVPVMTLRKSLTVGVVLALAPTLTSGVARPVSARERARDVASSSATMAIGERLVYDVKFGALRVGTGSMTVMGIDDVRGREAWHTVFTIKGGVPLYRVDDRLESWIDTATFTSLRFVQETSEGRRHRTRRIELFPDRGLYTEEGATPPEKATVDQPLDEAAFLYFLRRVPLVVGQSYSFDRYFKPDRNPIRLVILRRERIDVPAGSFETIVVRPIIKAKGIFSENGQAEVWLTDDSRHAVVQMKAKLSFGSLTLQLRDFAPVQQGVPYQPIP
jgi:hypothetical protein